MIVYAKSSWKVFRGGKAIPARKWLARSVFCLLAGLGVLGLSGCGDADQYSKEFFAERDEHRREREKRLWEEGDKLKSDEVIALVRQARTGSGGDAIDDWLKSELKALPGQVLFPRWTSKRRGATVFEVLFEAIRITPENAIYRISVLWSIDVLTRKVSEPEWVEVLDEVASHDSVETRQIRRASDLESDLE